MVKDHSERERDREIERDRERERGNPLSPQHELLFLISSKGSFICYKSHRQDITYHGLCCTSHEALAGTRKEGRKCFI